MPFISEITEKLGNELFALLFFAGGAVVGALLVFAAAFFLSRTKVKEKKRKEPTDLSALKAETREKFLGAKTEFDFRSKILTFSDCAIGLFEKISAAYSGEETESFDLFGKATVALDFTVYEFVDFLSELVEDIRRDVEDVFSSGKFRIMFFAYKLVDKNIEKDPTEVKLAYIFSVLTEEKEEKKGFITKVIGKIVAPVKTLAVKAIKPSVVGLVDGFFVSILFSFCDCVSDLYSHSVAYLPFAAESEEKGEKAV